MVSEAPVVGRRRRTDWRAEPRSAADDIAWAARRAAVAVAAAALEARDGGTATHSDDVVLLCDAVAGTLGVRGEQRAQLLAAAQLHDVGKVALPPEILLKPGPLTEVEWAEIHEHTITGERILASVPELDEVARIVRSSHERFDGTGYPDGLEGEDIPLASRIVFCADAFHAVRSDRPYRRGRSASKALAEVRRNAGTQFDPVVADALVKAARDLRIAKGRGRRAAATVESRRLAALLAAMAVSGGALAATGNLDRIVPGGGDDSPRPAEDAGALPASFERSGAGAPSKHARGGRKARAKAGRGDGKRRRGLRRAASGAPTAPTLGATGSPGGSADAQPPISGHDNGNGKSRGRAKGHAHAPGQLKPKAAKPKPKPVKAKPPLQNVAPPTLPDLPGKSELAPGQLKKLDK